MTEKSGYIAVMGWASSTATIENGIDTPMADEDFPLNAIGLDNEIGAWIAFHLRHDGQHCSRGGEIIKQHDHVIPMQTSDICTLLHARDPRECNLAGIDY